ncbi:MAG: T9SS type A sorting domain-containing protein [Saprospiraceae bacterium]
MTQVELSILNPFGKKVYQKYTQNEFLNLEDLPSGMYYLEIAIEKSKRNFQNC